MWAANQSPHTFFLCPPPPKIPLYLQGRAGESPCSRRVSVGSTQIPAWRHRSRRISGRPPIIPARKSPLPLQGRAGERPPYQRFRKMLQNFSSKIWSVRRIAVPLHSQKGDGPPEKPFSVPFEKKVPKNANKICTVQILVVPLQHFRLTKKGVSRERFF